LKALTLTQPWASLIAIGAKRIETRSWRTDYRGALAIHAAREGRSTWQDIADTSGPAFVDRLSAAGFTRATIPGPWKGLPYGSIIAVVRLADCVRVESLERQPITVYEHAFGNYKPGRYAWLLEDLRPLTKPIPCRGYQQLWSPDAATLAQVEEQLR
jgi:hypothetical protein